MPLKRAPSGNPAGFNGGIIPAGGGTATQTSVDNDLGAFGFVIDLTTGLPVNGVTVTAACTSGNCANNISAVTAQPTNIQPSGATTGYYQLGGLTRGTQYTFRVTAVPAGFRIVDSCQVSVTTPPACATPRRHGLARRVPTWFDPNLCVESLGILQPLRARRSSRAAWSIPSSSTRAPRRRWAALRWSRSARMRRWLAPSLARSRASRRRRRRRRRTRAATG